jgi:hypothetical protein
MKWKSLESPQVLRVAALLSLTGALLATSGGYAAAWANDSDSRPGLTGAWAVQVTPRDCTTDAQVAPTVNSLVTFHEGGTLSESAGGGAFAAGQRSAGHGTWAHDRPHSYLQKFVALMFFDTPANLPGTPGFDPSRPVSPGFFAGWQTVTHRVRIVDADHLTSAGTNAFYKTDGTLYRTGCSSATARRLD